jgi:uncharacterized membrane protein (UPF0127 family)
MARPAALAAFIAVSGGAAAQQPDRLALTVETAEGPHTLQVEVADTPQARSTGLMYRRTLDPDHGMLFDFGGEQPVSMWMKNTYIPLDMVFIGSDRRVRHIAQQTTPLSERTVESPMPVRYVLEIKGGRGAELGIAPGDMVSGPAIED